MRNMHRRCGIGLLAVVGLVTGCMDANPLVAPDTKPAVALSMRAGAADSLARGVAIALANDEVRMRVLEAMRVSPYKSHALDFKKYLKESGILLRDRAAAAIGLTVPEFDELVESQPELELAVGRPVDRTMWVGTADVVVHGAVTYAPEKGSSPMTTGYTTGGTSVSFSTYQAGRTPLMVIRPVDVPFAAQKDPNPLPLSGQVTISTREEEQANMMSPLARARAGVTNGRRATLSMLPDPCNSDPDGCNYPSPSYDGISLPSTFTAPYCFGWWTGMPDTADRDRDGIRDTCEYQLAYAFRPMLARNNHDDANEKEPYWSVARIPGSPTGIKIFYALSYYYDFGDPYLNISAHPGDSEFIILEVSWTNNPSHQSQWGLDRETLSAHWNKEGWDRTDTVDAWQIEFPDVYKGRPRVWVSWDKHANYRSKDICGSNWFEWCDTIGTGTTYEDVEVLSTANLGNMWLGGFTSYGAPSPMVNCAASRHASIFLPGTECFWDTSGFFRGWQGFGNDATPYGIMLGWYGF